MKVVSWNIAGGRKVKSLDHLDYDKEDLSYFISQLAQIQPDVVCFQESHTNEDREIASEIGTALGLNYCFNTPASPSHVDIQYRLGAAVISKAKFDNTQAIVYPDPNFELHWPDGRIADTHHKVLQLVNVGGVNIGNTQMLPLKLFGHTWNEGSGLQLAGKIDDVLTTINSPAIVCGDFNYDDPAEIYPGFFKKLNLTETLPDETTRPNLRGAKKRPDHIFISQGLNKINSGVIQTETDHYLCWAEIS